MKNIDDWTEREIFAYVMKNLGLKPGTKGILRCPIKGCNCLLDIEISRFSGAAKIYCRGYDCIKIVE